MRILIIFILLIILGFIGWKAAERFGVIEPVETPEEVIVEQGELPEPETAKKSFLPGFDIVRVDRNGYAVIAGRAAPGATVRVYVNDTLLSETIAESDGSWVMTQDTPLDAGPVELTLEMTTANGVTTRSEETIVIYVPGGDGDRPLVLRTTPGGATEVIQEPREADGSLGPLTLDAIDYDDSGAVIFSGRAEAGRIVQLFLNSQYLAQMTTSENGRWVITTPPGVQIAPGIYKLQAIQLDENGRPAYAIELPFERATAEQIDLRDGKVIVQPGNSLWRIARRAYGEGAQYTIIYQANDSQIRDPDLIYPGQIFDVPDTDDQGQTELQSAE